MDANKPDVLLLQDKRSVPKGATSNLTFPPAGERIAGASVAAIAELLEAILINIDMKTLLLSQRVNKTFKYVIAGSGTLRKKLFFEQATIDEAVRFCTVCCNSDSTDVRMFKASALGSVLPNGHYRLLYMFVLNPLIFLGDERRSMMDPRPNGRTFIPPSGEDNDSVDSSWKKMYFAHPSPLHLWGELRLYGVPFDAWPKNWHYGGLVERVGPWKEDIDARTITEYGYSIEWEDSTIRVDGHETTSRHVDWNA